MYNKRFALLDSSVWVSSMVKEELLNSQSREFINKLFKMNYLILVPKIVIVEVVNALCKSSRSSTLSDMFLKTVFQSKKCLLVDLDSKKLAKAVTELSLLSNLKASDLYILIFCRLKPNILFKSIDNKQSECYDYFIKKNLL